MTTLVKSVGDFFATLVQAFNFSSVIPALVLITLLLMYVFPLIPEIAPIQAEFLEEPNMRAIFIILSTIFIAYLLDAANFRIIRFFEGYWFKDVWPFRNWLAANQNEMLTARDGIRAIGMWLDEFRECIETDERLLPLAEKMVLRKRQLAKLLRDKYPEDPDRILPFALGNIIAAAEYYPEKTLGMNAVVMWPFLTPILTKKGYATFVIRAKSSMDFLINMAFVIIVFICAQTFVALRYFDWNADVIFRLVFFAVAFYLLLLTAYQAAANLGATIKAAFVIYRQELMKSLHLRIPKDYQDEVNLWETTSNFLRARDSRELLRRWGAAIFDPEFYRSDEAPADGQVKG